MNECPEPAHRDALAVAVVEAARRFADSLRQIPHWREYTDSEDAAALVAAVQMMEDGECS